MEEGTLLVWNIKAVREGKTAQEGNPYHRKRRNPMKTTLASRAFLIRNRKKQPVLRGAKPSDGLLGRGSSPHRTGCCIPYDGTGRNRLHAARYRNLHTRVTNILPLFLPILGANFSLFLRFKGPASKGTGIDPRVRFQGTPFKKRPDAGLCARPLKKHETLNSRQWPLAASLHPLQALLTPRPSNALHPAPFNPPSAPPVPFAPHPARFPNSSMAAQNRSHGFHVVSNRSPSRIRSVRLISLGMTTRPSSSILRTIPVARNVPILLDGGATLMPHCFAVCLCIPSMEFGGVIMRRKDLGRAGAGWVLEKNSARPKPGATQEKRFD